MIHADSTNFYQLEHFLTYAINHIGQQHLKCHVTVHIYGDSQQLHSHLHHNLMNLCKQVVVHEGEDMIVIPKRSIKRGNRHRDLTY